MNAADRIALVERLARAAAWTSLSEDKRRRHRQRASDAIREMEVSREQLDRLGWIFVEVEPEDGVRRDEASDG